MSRTPSDDRARLCTGNCGRMTRHAKMSKADYPDTVTRSKAGRCTSCQRHWMQAQQDPVDLVAKAEAERKKKEAGVAAAFAARNAYLAGRRRRQALSQRRGVGRLSA